MTDKNKDIEIIDELDTNLMDHEYDAKINFIGTGTPGIQKICFQ